MPATEVVDVDADADLRGCGCCCVGDAVEARHLAAVDGLAVALPLDRAPVVAVAA